MPSLFGIGTRAAGPARSDPKVGFRVWCNKDPVITHEDDESTTGDDSYNPTDSYP